jgi:hypothetical protein
MTQDYRHIAERKEYQLDCPEGIWNARLDAKAWGKSKNLILYFSDRATGLKYWFSVFHREGYRSRDGQDFRDDAEPGDVFELTTGKNKTGSPRLLSARKIHAGASAEQENYAIQG